MSIVFGFGWLALWPPLTTVRVFVVVVFACVYLLVAIIIIITVANLRLPARAPGARHSNEACTHLGWPNVVSMLAVSLVEAPAGHQVGLPAAQGGSAGAVEEVLWCTGRAPHPQAGQFTLKGLQQASKQAKEGRRGA